MFMRISHRTMMKTPNGRHKLTNMFGLSDETAALFTELNDLTDLVFVIVILLDVRSTGFVELASLDPAEYPKIRTQFLRDPAEVEAMLRGIEFVEKLAETEPLKSYGLQLEHLDYPGCAHLQSDHADADAYRLCALQQIATGFYHPASTVRMGAENDPTAALDSRFRVKGVHGLRVVDASAMPRLVSSNPNGPVIMMAERAADIIKEEYLRQPSS